MRSGVLAVTPHRPGGPPVWVAGALPASLERVGKLCDGWIPNAGDAAQWRRQWADLEDIARRAGRDPATLTGAMYLTLSVDDDAARANARLDAGAAHIVLRFAGEHERHLDLFADLRDSLAAG